MNWIRNILLEDDEKHIKSKYITPIILENDNEYYNKIQHYFQELIGEMRSTNVDDSFLEIAKYYQQNIMEALQNYYSGFIDLAQKNIDAIIFDLIENDKNIALSNIKDSISFHDKGIVSYSEEDKANASDVQFFRARISDHYCVFDRNEMLHIPFNQRQKINTQRFSIPGLPCIYLGTTSYCCWLELDTPPDHRFNVSAIRLDNTQRILNITVNSNDLLILCETNDIDIIRSSFKLWLLSYVTSFRIKSKDRVFKSEYILPQLFMLSCLKYELDGIAYYTKRIENDMFAYLIGVNLALFAKYDNEPKYSKVCNEIEMTKSYNYSMFKQLHQDQKYRAIRLNVENGYYPRLIDLGGFLHEYRGTEFFSFDQFLFAQNPEQLKKVDLEKFNK